MCNEVKEDYRAMCKKHNWPDPPEGEVTKLSYQVGTRDLYVFVNGEWHWSREAKGPWHSCPNGPSY